MHRFDFEHRKMSAAAFDACDRHVSDCVFVERKAERFERFARARCQRSICRTLIARTDPEDSGTPFVRKCAECIKGKRKRFYRGCGKVQRMLDAFELFGRNPAQERQRDVQFFRGLETGLDAVIGQPRDDLRALRAKAFVEFDSGEKFWSVRHGYR
jgi:hypothetical protein